MTKMKIVIISRTLPYLGGREIIVDKIIRSLSERGVKILLITPDNYKNKKIRIVKSSHNYQYILKKILEFNPDVINCHTFYFYNLALKLSKDLNKPLITTLHGIFINIYGKSYRQLIKKIIINSNQVIVVSDNFKNTLEKEFHIKNKIVCIKNGIKKPIFKDNSITHKQKIIIVPTRLHKVKGIEYAIKAMKKLDNNIYKMIISSPKGRNNFDEVLYELELKKLSKDLNIKFEKNNQSKLFNRLKHSDVCLLPSLSEGISLSILETMSLGKIAIATKVGGNSEIIRNNINGFLIPPRNCDIIAEKIIKISKMSHSRIRKICYRAAKTIDDNFNERKMVDQYYKLFKKYYEN